MKKTIITLSAIFFSFLVMAQKNSTKKDYNFFNDGHSYWTIDATFGVIAGWDEQAYTDNNILYTEKNWRPGECWANNWSYKNI